MQETVDPRLGKQSPEEEAAGNVPFFYDDVIKAIHSGSCASRQSWLANGSTELDQPHMPSNTNHDNTYHTDGSLYSKSLRVSFVHCTLLCTLYKEDRLESLVEKQLKHWTGWCA